MRDTTATSARPRRSPPPFDPHLAAYAGEHRRPDADPRLTFLCPSRRTPGGYLLVCDEDGGHPWCSCEGYAYRGQCTHAAQAAAIVRLALEDRYATMPETALVALDRALAARPRHDPARGSIRADVLGDAIAARLRRRDTALLNARGRQAKAELFG